MESPHPHPVRGIRMTSTDKVSDAASISRLNTAYAEARILHSASEIGLFDFLADRSATRAEICEGLGLHPRLLRDFLAAAAALGLVEHGGDEYRNTPAARRFLVPGGEVYLGGRVKSTARRHYHTWGRLTEALRGGEPQADMGGDAFARLYADRGAARDFLVHMDANNAQVAMQITELMSWSERGSFVDVGGARGNVAAHLVKRWPKLRGGVFELPAVEPFFDELMAEEGVADRVVFHPGDFFADPLPEADVLMFGHVLHDWSAEKRHELLRRTFDVVRPGGAVVIYDQMLDDEDPDLRSLIGSLNVALITPGGSEYTVEECRVLLEKTGFRFASATRLPRGNDTVVVGTKDA